MYMYSQGFSCRRAQAMANQSSGSMVILAKLPR